VNELHQRARRERTELSEVEIEAGRFSQHLSHLLIGAKLGLEEVLKVVWVGGDQAMGSDRSMLTTGHDMRPSDRC
jgi:hypothetical protein